MALPRELALSDDELNALMTTSWNMRIATVGPGERINLTPMWFGWAQGKIFTYARGQKIANLRRNPVCTVLVDKNERFPELIGATFQGRAKVLESAEEEDAEPGMEEVRLQMGHKYWGGHGAAAQGEPGPNTSTARGRSRRWVVFTPEKLVTWDNHKLADLRRE